MHFWYFTKIFLAVWFALISFVSYPDVVFRDVHEGRLVGKTGTDRKGNRYYSFLSIPFAKPPLSDLRFADPVEPEPWNGVRNATVGHPVCPQTIRRKYTGSEDCLYLNVHTPADKHSYKRLKPVFVFMHGGGFLHGTGQNYGPQFLMPECVVLVTINYRLGLFGFLNSDDTTLGIPGNAGMKDQVMALRWVKNNIKNFGGNSRKIMIVGQSSGAASVHLHMLSARSKRLFHRVAALSGNGELSWSFGLRNTLEPVGACQGITSNNSREILRALRKLSTHEMLATQDNYLTGFPIHRPFEASPSIEPESPRAFLSKRPIDIINSGKYYKVPLMMGYTNKDGFILEVLDRLSHGSPRMVTDFKQMVPHNINKTGLDLDAISLEIKNLYFGADDVPSEDNLEKIGDMFTGIYFISALPMVLQAHLRQKAPIYLYKFSADTGLTNMKYLTPETSHYKGAMHYDDLNHLFNTIYTPTSILPNSDEDRAIDNVVKLFSNFAKSGNPRNDWLPVTRSRYNYMDIGISSVPGVNPDYEQFLFWEDFYRKYL